MTTRHAPCGPTHMLHVVQAMLLLLMMMMLMLSVFSPSSHAFNIDVKNVKRMEGPEGSEFGHSVAYDEKANRMLVGAPKEVLTIKGNSRRSGAVHICSLETRRLKLDCSTTYHSLPSFFNDINSVNVEGYGTSISVSDSGTALVCAPFWEDTSYKSRSFSFMPGRCVLLPDSIQASHTDVKPYYYDEHSANKYMPKSTKELFHGMATLGLSSDVSGDSTFVMGAPGLSIFEGGIYIRDPQGSSESGPKTAVNTLNTRTAYGYLGYAVKFGDFCDRYLCVAAGAPNLNFLGRVSLFKRVSEDILYKYQDLIGEKAWSYFGSVLSAVDTDQDGFDELLVGAPYYSDASSRSFDTGRVYVYKRGKLQEDMELQMTLQGRGAEYGRFGSAIQGIGDINLDTYPDVAIGAPGEDENSGCVYIYEGGPHGLVFSQRISAKEVNHRAKSPLKGFGSTLSGPIKDSRSEYPVFAASSLPTDTVILFGMRVIVKVNAVIEASPTLIDLNEKCDFDPTADPCTTFKVCYTQKMEGIPTRKLDYLVNVDMDSQRMKGVRQRVQFKNITGSLVDRLADIHVYLDSKKFCQEFKVITNKDIILKDRFTPIEFKVTMMINEARLAGSFNPILDPKSPNTFTHMLSLANECGHDNMCEMDLAVTGSIQYSHSEDWPYIVVGHTKEFRVVLTVSNFQETSYGTKVVLELSQAVPYFRSVSDSIKQCKTESSDSGVNFNTVVVCRYYQPLRQDSSIDISFVFGASEVSMDQTTIQAVARVASINEMYSREKEPKDNELQMETNVFIVADVNMFGSSSPAEVTIKNAKRIDLTAQETITKNFTQAPGKDTPIVLNHKYQMINMGPSFLPRTHVFLSIPVYLPDASQLISGISVQLKSGDQEAVSCTDIVKKIDGGIGFPRTTAHPLTTQSAGLSASTEGGGKTDDPEVTTLWTPGSGVVNKKRRRRAAVGGDDADVDGGDGSTVDLSKAYVMTCDSSPEYCVIFRCELKSAIQPKDHVTFNVTMDVDRDNIPIPQDFTSFYMQLQTFVQQPNHILFKPWTTQGFEQASSRTSTMFHLIVSGEEIDLWIIIVSVVGGLLLLVCIAAICWKLGFFKRKKHVEMEQWRRKSVRMSKAVEMPEINK